MDSSRNRTLAIAGGAAGLALLCACGGGLGWFLYSRGDTSEKVSTWRAATSGRGHKDLFHAPDGSLVHFGGGEIVGPTALDLDLYGRFVGRDLGAPELLDAVPGPHRVDVFQDADHGSVSKIVIDLDRDGSADEVWTVEVMHVTRKVSMSDDGNLDASFHWSDKLWVFDN